MHSFLVLFGKSRFDFPQDQTIPAYIDIGRQSLWGLIYLIPGTNIVTARVWNDFLFTIPCALLGWALLRKQSSCRGFRLLAYSLWAMLFLMQGPIYTPLTLAAILVALGSRTPLVINCLLTAIAGFYAVMSRSTWIAAPSAFAVFLSFLDQKAVSSDTEKKARWWKAVALGLSGLAGAGIYMKREIFARLLHIGIETAAVPEITAASTAATEAMEAVPQIFTPAWFQYYLGRQALLFDRLWPNETYKTGIVLGLALAVLPLIILIIIWTCQRRWNLDGWQKLLLYAGSGIFLIAGLIFSVKIGGGSNLHNLDMFLILMLIVSALAWKAGMGGWLAEKILVEFNLDPQTARILNGHVPVKIKNGESPIKGGGLIYVIDGGISKAYQKTTGIAGYTLIYNSRGMMLAEHKPYQPLKEDGTQEFSAPTMSIVYTLPERKYIIDTI